MTPVREAIGLLVMHYGTPPRIEDVEAYYTHIRRGIPPSPEQLADLVARYEAIGGPSPLTRISEEQGKAIRAALEARGVLARLYMGAKHASPFVADVVETMSRDGIERAVGLVLAPHYSSYSIATYKHAALAAHDSAGSGMKMEFIDHWGTMPSFIEALALRVFRELDGLNAAKTLVIFTAHSLPEKILASGDPYKDELLQTSRLVAERLVLPRWTFAFQSASNTGEPWLGPDIVEVIEENAGRYPNIIVCPIGFVSEHLEVLYDLDIEARKRAAELGVNFRRAACINADPDVMDGLAELVVGRLS